MISINDLTLSFGGTTLLDHIGFHINDKDRIGLVGRNGAGKSTILKLIMGLQVPTSGQIVRPSDLRIGYLPQVMDHPRGRTVMAETMRAFEEFHRLNDRLDAVSRQIAERTEYGQQTWKRGDFHTETSLPGNSHSKTSSVSASLDSETAESIPRNSTKLKKSCRNVS